MSALLTTTPVDWELLGTCRGGAGKEDRLFGSADAFDFLENGPVVQEGVVIVHGLRVGAVVVDNIDGDALAEVRFDAVDPGLQQMCNLAGEPGAGGRIGKVD